MREGEPAAETSFSTRKVTARRKAVAADTTKAMPVDKSTGTVPSRARVAEASSVGATIPQVKVVRDSDEERRIATARNPTTREEVARLECELAKGRTQLEWLRK